MILGQREEHAPSFGVRGRPRGDYQDALRGRCSASRAQQRGEEAHPTGQAGSHESRQGLFSVKCFLVKETEIQINTLC